MKKRILFLSVLLVAGCATTSVPVNTPPVTGKGSPPEIVSVYFEPREPTVADPVYLVIDYKGEVDKVNLYVEIITAAKSRIKSSGGSSTRVIHDGMVNPKQIGFGGQKEKGSARIYLGSKWVGTPTLFIQLYLLDAGGNKSNEVRGKVEISPSNSKAF